jgi:alpha-beta hydrolase superfamily lysophospholipase
VGCAALASTFVALEAFRGARAEAALFSPPRAPIHLPHELDGVPVRDVAFGDGSAIRGWYIPSQNGAAVVLAHGSGADRSQLSTEARLLADAGFGVLAFDWPGHGESAGKVTYGPPERAALRAAVAFASSQPGVDARRIGALGFSVGAALVAVTAPEEPRLHAIALVACFADSDEQTRDQFLPGQTERRLRGLFGVAFGAARAVQQWAAVRVDHAYMADAPLRPVDSVRGLADRDVLVIAASEDPVVPSWMSQDVYDGAAGRKEWLLLDHQGHGGLDALESGPYREALLRFFRQALAAPANENQALSVTRATTR